DRSRPVQIQPVVAIDLLTGRAAVYLHDGLLVTVVPRHVECTYRRPWHLCHGRPWIPPTGNVLQQRLAKSRRRLHTLQVHYGIGLHPNNLGHVPYCKARINRRREASRQNNSRLRKRPESSRLNAQLVVSKRQQIKQEAAIGLRGCVLRRKKR